MTSLNRRAAVLERNPLVTKKTPIRKLFDWVLEIGGPGVKDTYSSSFSACHKTLVTIYSLPGKPVDWILETGNPDVKDTSFAEFFCVT